MGREERRRKLHEALLQTLYPPALPPEEGEQEAEPSNASMSGLDLELKNLDADDSDERSSISRDDNGQDEGETHKLTRAQRKRRRKKKLREDLCRRGKILGPLLPPVEEKGAQGVQRNAAEEPASVNTMTVVHVTEEPGNSSKQKRVKQRRVAKKIARDGSKSTQRDFSARMRSSSSCRKLTLRGPISRSLTGGRQS